MSQEKIAVIGGTGDLGFGLALRWARAGVQVIIGSRDESKAKEAAQRAQEMLKAHAPPESARLSISGLENAQAAAQASVVVLAVPISAQVAILKSIRGSLERA